jgi:hypothetical protein
MLPYLPQMPALFRSYCRCTYTNHHLKYMSLEAVS